MGITLQIKNNNFYLLKSKIRINITFDSSIIVVFNFERLKGRILIFYETII